jgi:DnaJ-class molecular chaperone
MFGGGGGPFGAMGGGPPRGGPRVRREKGPVKVHEVPLGIADFYNGKQLHVEFDRQKFCNDCKGEGFTSFKSCDGCGGSGHVTRMGMIGPGMAVQMNGPCPDCQGVGKQGSNSCGKCKGKKFLTQAKTLDVKIEPGMKAGDILVFPNECSDNHDFVTPGDVHFILQEADEETIWKRDGNHLRTTIDIGLEQSLLGTKKVLNGHPGFVDGYEVVVPIGTQNQEVLRLSGGGMPIRGSMEKGDALVTVRVTVAPKERELLEKNKLIFQSMFL